MTSKKIKKDKKIVKSENYAHVDLEKNELNVNGDIYEVERAVAEFIYDMIVYTDHIADNYALVASKIHQAGANA